MRTAIFTLLLLTSGTFTSAAFAQNCLVLNWSHDSSYNSGPIELTWLAVALTDIGFDQTAMTAGGLELFIWLFPLAEESDTAAALLFYMRNDSSISTVDVMGMALAPPPICSPGDLDSSLIPIPGGPAPDCFLYDFDGSGVVDNADFLHLSANYGVPGGYDYSDFLKLSAYFGHPCN